MGRTNSRPRAPSPEPGNPASQRGRREGQEHRGETRSPGVENAVVWSSHGEREASGGHGSQGETGTIGRGGVSAATAQHAAHGEGRVCGTDSPVSRRPPQEMSLLAEGDGQRLAAKDKGGREDEQQRQREQVNETDVQFQVGFFLWCFPFLFFPFRFFSFSLFLRPSDPDREGERLKMEEKHNQQKEVPNEMSGDGTQQGNLCRC